MRFESGVLTGCAFVSLVAVTEQAVSWFCSHHRTRVVRLTREADLPGIWGEATAVGRMIKMLLEDVHAGASREREISVCLSQTAAWVTLSASAGEGSMRGRKMERLPAPHVDFWVEERDESPILAWADTESVAQRGSIEVVETQKHGLTASLRLPAIRVRGTLHH